MGKMKLASALAFAALLTAGCDPEAPVQSSNVTDEINGAVDAHAADPTTHTNLLIPAANLTGEIDGDQIEDGSIGIADIGTGAVGSDEIADQSIAFADLSAGSVGALQLVDDSVTSAKIAANAITASEIAAGAISGGIAGPITDNTITTADVMNDSILSADISDNSLTGADIADNILTDADIMDDSLTAASLANNSVGAGELADNAVDANAIQTDAVTTAKITDANVTAAKLGSLSVTQAKLNTDMAGELQDAATGANNNIFTFRNTSGGALGVTIWGVCESNVNGSQVFINDGAATADGCPNTALNGPPEIFILTDTMVMNNTNVTFQIDAGANDGIVRWRIYGIQFQ